MKECEKLEAYDIENRKALLEKQNKMIQRKLKTPEPSVLGSSIFSYDISLNSLSIKTESENVKETPFQNCSSRSKKPSELLYECMNTNISLKDQKILRLMAERREAKIREKELALSAKIIWEEEKLREAKKAEEKKKALMNYLAKKKRVEDFEKFIRNNDRNENLKQEKRMLEMKINEKHKKAEKRQKNIFIQRKYRPEILTSKSQIILHQEMKRQEDERKEYQKTLHEQLCKAKERKSEEKLKQISMERCKKIKQESLKREIKWQAAKNLRDELNRKHEEEQMKNIQFFERSQAIREERVHWTTEWKRKIILEKNEREKQQHALIYKKIKEEEAEKLNQRKKEIQAKYSKMKIFRECREANILRSRYNAKTVSCLRQKMRSTYDL